MKPKKMILPRYRMGLSAEQFRKLYMEDLATFNRRQIYHEKELFKKLKKVSIFPCRYMFKEQHGLEELRAYCKIENKKHPFPEDGLSMDIVIYFKNGRGLCAYLDCDPFDELDYVDFGSIEGGKIHNSHCYLFTPHFFERYEERHGLEDGFKDIRNQFFFRNRVFGYGAFDVCISPSRENDHKRLDVWVLCQDGLLLGQIHGNEQDAIDGKDFVMQINTFLDASSLNKRQDGYSGALNLLKEFYIRYPRNDGESEAEHAKRVYEVFKKDFNRK